MRGGRRGGGRGGPRWVCSMTPEEKLAQAEAALVEVEKEFTGARAGELRQALIAMRMNWACSRILPSHAMYRHLVRKFRQMEHHARQLADFFESCPSAEPTDQ